MSTHIFSKQILHNLATTTGLIYIYFGYWVHYYIAVVSLGLSPN